MALRLLLFLLIVLGSCSVWQRTPTMWKDIRPLWEERLTDAVWHGFYQSDKKVQVSTFVIPIGEPPEIRLVILAPLEDAQRDELVTFVEKQVRRVMRYASDQVYTDRIRLQVTTYDGGERRTLEYWAHEWNVMPESVSDTQLLREALTLQRNLAKQQRLE